MNEPMTLNEAIKNIVLGVVFIGTPLVGGILLDSFIEMLIFYGVFGGVNIALEEIKKKQHAESIFRINEKLMCFICSNVILFICLFVLRLSENVVSFWHSMVLSVLVCIFVTVGIGNVTYGKPLDDEYKDLRRRIKSMTKKETMSVLQDNLPENEYKAIYYCDFEGIGINYVADAILFCSPRTVSGYRKAGYEKLRRLYSKQNESSD